MITIHHEKETDFSKNGYGAIDNYVMNQEVYWEMNGQFYAYLEYPAFLDKADYLINKNILRIPVPFMDDQLFRIYRTRKVLGFIQVEARHIFYDLMDNLIEDTNIVGKNGSQAVQQLLAATQYGHQFTGLSDITTTNNARMVRYNPVEALLDDTQANTFVSRWGGEVVRDNFIIRMAKQMGSDRGVHIQHKKDLLGYEATIDESTVVTRIMPIGFDGLKLPELYIDSPLIDLNNPKIRVIKYDDVKAATGMYAEDEDAIPVAEAYALLRKYAKEEFSVNHLDEPETTVTVNFASLHNTKEYEEFSQLQEIQQGDVVKVSVPEEGFEVTSRLVAFTSDPLQLNHYTSTTLGNHVFEFTSSSNDTTIVRNEVEQLRESVVTAMQSANGKNRNFWGTADPNTLSLNASVGDNYYRENGEETTLYQYVELNGERYWKEIIDTSKVSIVAGKVEEAMAEAEQAKQGAVDAYENAVADAKAHADAEDARIRGELESEVGGAIDLAEQAKADAVTKANQALADAKAHADAGVQASKEHFDNLIQGVESDVADAQATANSAVEQIDTAIASAGFTSLDDTLKNISGIASGAKSELDTAIENAGFTSLDETLQNISSIASGAQSQIDTAIQNAGFTSLDDTIRNMNYITMNAEQNAQQAITDASNAYDLAQTSISEAQTAQANSLTALGKADNALDGVSNLDIRVDDVEAELELKADNTFINEDGTLTTLSNAITFNANRFSSDMSRIESRVESLAGEINLVVLRGSIENRLLYGNEVFPNAPSYSASTNVMSELIDVVGGESFSLSKELTGADDRWRINFYDENYNVISRFHPPANTQDIMVAPSNARYMWVSYPQNSKPQIIRGTNFIPYRPNLADQMTTDEMVIFRNEYDEFADRTERRLTTIDSSGGRLDTAELLITQTADGLALKADQTTVNELAETVSTLDTDVSVVAGQINSKVWKTDIDGIKIGGRNLILDSSNKTFYGTNSDAWGLVKAQAFELSTPTEVGQTYTITVKGFINGGNPRLDIYLVGTQNILSFNHSPERKVYTATFTANVAVRHIHLYGSHIYGIEIDYIQLEKGNKATDWTPAPEDTDAKIDHIETEWTQTFNTFSQTVSSIDGRVTGQKQTIDSISSAVSGHDSRISTVEQIASGLQTTVADKANQTQVTQLANGYNILASQSLKSLVPKDLSGDTSEWNIGGNVEYSGQHATNLSTIYVTGSDSSTLYGGNRIHVDSVLTPGKRYKITLDVWSVSNRHISIGQAESRNNVQLTVGNTTKTYEVIYEASSTYGFSIFFHTEGTYRIGNITVHESTAISQSQISVLQDSITSTVSNLDGRVTQQKQTIDGIETTIQSTQKDLDGTKTLLNATKSTVDGHVSTIATLRTDVDGKATTAQFNTLNSTVNGTIQRVGNAEGKITQIETNVSGLQTTVADKASKTQVTQLANSYNILVSQSLKSLVPKDLSDATSKWELGGNVEYIGQHTSNLSNIYVTGSNPDTSYGGNRIHVDSVLTPGRRYKITLDVWSVSNRQISIGQAESRNNVRLTVGSTTKTYEVIYEAPSTYGFSIYFHHEGTYRIGNITVHESTAVSQSQISVLQDSITLAVSGLDGRVTSQKQTIDTISSTVSGHDGRLSTVEQTASGLQSTVNDPNNGLVTQVTQLANGYNILVSESLKSLVAKNLFDSASEWELGSNVSYQGQNSSKVSTIYVTGSNPDSGYDGNRVQVESVLVPGRRYKITLDVWSVSNRYVTIGQAKSRNNIRLLIGNSIKTYEVVYEATSANGFSIFFHTQGTHYIGNITVVESTAVSQSQISVLQDNINLRVSKGELLSQINIEADRTLIQSNQLVLDANTVRFTGSAFIPSAQIESLDAKKITTGTIATARLNATDIVTSGLTANVIKSTHIQADELLVDKVFSNQASVNRLWAKDIWANKITTMELKAGQIKSGTIETARLNAKDIVTSGLTANVIESTHIKTDVLLVDKIFANQMMVDRLWAKEIWSKKINAIEIDASQIKTGTLDAAEVTIINLDVNTLTGNKSSFITSLFNGTNSSVRITSDGMDALRNDGSISARFINDGLQIWGGGNWVGSLSYAKAGMVLWAKNNRQLDIGYQGTNTLPNVYTAALTVDGNSGATTLYRDTYLNGDILSKINAKSDFDLLGNARFRGDFDLLGNAWFRGDIRVSQSGDGMRFRRLAIGLRGGVAIMNILETSGIWFGDNGTCAIMIEGAWVMQTP